MSIRPRSNFGMAMTDSCNSFTEDQRAQRVVLLEGPCLEKGLITSEVRSAPVQLIEQHLETRNPKKENASNLAVVPRPNRYEGATQTNQTLIVLGSLACLIIS